MVRLSRTALPIQYRSVAPTQVFPRLVALQNLPVPVPVTEKTLCSCFLPSRPSLALFQSQSLFPLCSSLVSSCLSTSFHTRFSIPPDSRRSQSLPSEPLFPWCIKPYLPTTARLHPPNIRSTPPVHTASATPEFNLSDLFRLSTFDFFFTFFL